MANPSTELPNALGLEESSESARQNLATEVEEAINLQITRELDVSYQYLAMVSFSCLQVRLL